MADLSDEDFGRPSGCTGRLVRDDPLDALTVRLAAAHERAPTEAEQAEVGEPAARFPLY